MDLIKGVSYAKIAARCGSSKSAVARHYNVCLVRKLVEERRREQFRKLCKDMAEALKSANPTVDDVPIQSYSDKGK